MDKIESEVGVKGDSSCSPEVEGLPGDKVVLNSMTPPTSLEIVEAERALSLFRLLFRMVCVTLALALLTFLGKYFEIGILNRNVIETLQIGVPVALFCVFVAIVRVALELGENTLKWWDIYSHSNKILSLQKAAELERKRKSPASHSRQASINSDVGFYSPIGDSLDFGKYKEIFYYGGGVGSYKWIPENYSYLVRSAVERLEREIDKQGSRANTNLCIALFVAAVGVAILGWLVNDVNVMISSPPSGHDNQMLFYIGAFVAKLILSISANVFAFFFLSTYRRNLSEIRYFHNELTNIQARVLSVYIALEKSLEPSLADALRGLSTTERNFILKKDETTVDLTMKGLDKEEVGALSATLAELMKILKSRKVCGETE